MPIPLSLYVHIPWCVQKCPYCDFNSHGLQTKPKSHTAQAFSQTTLPEQEYVERLLQDLTDDVVRFSETRPLTSIFIGGGTPSLFSGAAIARLLDGIRERLSVDEHTEITLEANPGTVDEAHFSDYFQAGVNRLSIGVQSFNAQHLTRLGRIHSPEQAVRAVKVAQSAGLENINIDIMFGLPNQTLDQAINDIEQAIALNTEHLSYYQLTLEPNTAFAHRPPRLPDEAVIDGFFEAAQERLQQRGFHRYEVSAWSRNRQAQHNVNYWQHGDYLGIGAGAHGKITTFDETTKQPVIIRTTKPRSPMFYLSPKMQRMERCVAEQDKAFELMLNVLRLTQGFSRQWISQRGLIDEQNITPILKQLENKGLLTRSNTHVAPTALGQRFVNDMVEAFLP